MSRNMVGLLAAVGATMSALVSLVHGDLVPLMIIGVGTATGLAAFLALPLQKKLSEVTVLIPQWIVCTARCSWKCPLSPRRA